jgi:chitinase
MVEECSGGGSDDGNDDGGDDGNDDGGDSNLEAVIDSSDVRVDVGESVELDMTGSKNWESYEWYMGGEMMDWDATPSYSFSEKGTYDIKLTVMDGNGNSDSTTKSIFVGKDGGTEPGEKRVVAYYRQWAQYDRDYKPSDIPLDKVTHVQYAFARPEKDASITLVGNDSHGQFAFWDKDKKWRDGIEGGTFAQLAEQNDDTKFTLSIGGWGDSEYFSNAALNEENRQKFADECAKWIDRGNLDGIDLDWEYPHGGGCTSESNVCDMDNIERDGDVQRFTKLCRAVRERLDEKAAEEGREEPYELSAAVSISSEDMAPYDHEELSDLLDHILIMTFDTAGIWSEYTRHHAPLKENPEDPFEDSDKWNASYSLSWFEQQGWDPEQLNMAVPFYGRSWTGIKAPNGEGNGEDDGLFQKYSGEDEDASGDGSFPSWGGNGTSLGGIWESFDLVGNGRGSSNNLNLDSGDWETYIDEDAVTAWSYSETASGGESLMISHDTEETMQMKAEWLRDSPYGGTMLWAISGDTTDHTLLSTLYDTLNG